MKHALNQLIKLIKTESSSPSTKSTQSAREAPRIKATKPKGDAQAIKENTENPRTGGEKLQAITKQSPIRQYLANSAKQKQGEHAERMAQNYLEQQGMRFVASNVASNLGEIDLIMRDGGSYVFVEVKARTGKAFGGVAYAITAQKLSRLRKAIELYLQLHPEVQKSPCRVDAVLIQGRGAQLKHYDSGDVLTDQKMQHHDHRHSKGSTRGTSSPASAQEEALEQWQIDWIRNIEL